MSLSIGTGAIIRLRNFRHYFEPDNTTRIVLESVDYTANPQKGGKKKVFVAVLLGTEYEDQTNGPLDLEAAMREMGYIRITEQSPAPAKEEAPTADDPGEGERPGVVSGSSERIT